MSKTNNKQKILDAAQELIQKFGANGMSYNSISKIVGISRASIHHHFPTKEKLIEELLHSYSEFFFNKVDAILHSQLKASEKLDEYISLFELTLRGEEKICLCGILGAELATLDILAVEIIRNFYRKNEDILFKILDQGEKQNCISIVGDTKNTAALIFSLLEGAMVTSRALGDINHFQKIVSQLKNLIK
ncbi:TetR/AcrR family transcriptional regulator [Candidatus Uabimicrobium sp. HlEnr_7]|uniref:TetR/AcrR family transcriptional regulator n=1 Tax=Candidatus Uabimicrobium helgolandensis TaxID=3095367 RepID=UPI0035561C23